MTTAAAIVNPVQQIQKASQAVIHIVAVHVMNTHTMSIGMFTCHISQVTYPVILCPSIL